MATTLITEFPIFVFSSQLREIEFSTDLDRLVISLDDGLTEIFRTTIYAYDGIASLINIAEVIENYMINTDQVFTAFTMYYHTADGTTLNSFNINTLYCSHIIDGSAGIFGSTSFLSTLPSRRLPSNGLHIVSLFHGQDSGSLKLHCSIRTKSGSVEQMTLNLQSVATDDLGVTPFKFRADVILAGLKVKNPDVEKLLAYTVEFNGRYCTAYITDEVPDIAFTFKNCFNVEETIYLNAVTTTKTKVNRSMAISQGRHSFYDQSVDKTYEVETAPLTQAEADWIEQLFMSHSVKLGTAYATSSLPEVIITESTCEIDDNDEQLKRVKFTWQFVDQRPRSTSASASDSDGIFTEPYNYTFT